MEYICTINDTPILEENVAKEHILYAGAIILCAARLSSPTSMLYIRPPASHKKQR